MSGNNTPRKKPFIDDALKDQLKEEANILDLFRLFGLAAQEIKATSKPGQFKAKCVFPNCKTAKPHDFPMGINTEKNTFNCFHCGKGGDIFKAIMQLKGLNFYNSKVFLHELIRGNNQAIQDVVGASPPSMPNPNPTANKPPENDTTKHFYKPFRRRLTGLRVEGLPVLESKGITPKTAEKFGVGYCSQGMMKGRIVVPVYDSTFPGTEDKNILCYGGYSLTKKAKEFGDWKFPEGFEKGKQLFNLNRVTVETKKMQETVSKHGLIVVESFWNILKLHQAGIKNVVATMGTALTATQEKLLFEITDKVQLWLDTDQAGTKGLQNILRSPEHGGNNGLIYKAYVKVIDPRKKIDVGERVKPYEFDEEEIKAILS